MGKVVLAYPNRAGSLVAYSGGAWSTALPLANLLTRQLAQVARTTNADARNSWFYMAATAAVDCSRLVLCRHNLGSTAQHRLRGFTADPRPAVHLNFTLGTLPAGVTLARSTLAWYFNAAGLLTQAAINEARFAYDAAGKRLGLMQEANATNYAPYSRDATQAAGWSVSNATRIKSSTGLDGVASSAVRLTATGANGRLSCTHALSGTAAVWSVYLRRITGTGTVSLSSDNWATFQTVTLTAAWQRFSMTFNNAAGQCGIQIATSGDAIDIDCAQIEAGSYPSSPIVTPTNATVARGADWVAYTVPASTVPWDTLAMSVSGIMAGFPTSVMSLLTVSDAGGTKTHGITCGTTGATGGSVATTGGTASLGTAGSITMGAAFRMCLGVNTAVSTECRLGLNGSQATPANCVAGTPTFAGTMSVGQTSGAYSMVVEQIKLHASAMPSADVLSLSGSDFERAAQYDSGLINAWPAEYIAGTTAEQRSGMVGNARIKPAAVQTYRYWRADMADESNPAGYLQLGRVFLGTGWTPAYNMAYGAGIGYDPRSSSVETDSGAEYFIARPNPRTVAVAIEYMTEAEAMDGIFELQRQLGTTDEVWFEWDADDLLQMPRRSFLGRLKTMDKLRMPYYHAMQCALEVKELL